MGVAVTSLSPQTRSCATLRARHRDEESPGVLELSGEADIATLAMLGAELAESVATNPEHLVVDVADLRFCDVHSAHLILTACRTSPTRVTGATGSVKRVFDLLTSLERARTTLRGFPGPGPEHRQGRTG